MLSPLIEVTIPLVILAALAIVGAKLKAKGQFILPPSPYWPDAEDPGLAMELASSAADVNRLLGTSDTKAGKANRHTIVAIQKLDRFFIPLYVLFFIYVASRFPALGWRLGVSLAALITGVLDYLEDYEIVRLAEEKPGSSARAFGRAKWFFYFFANGLASALLLPPGQVSFGKGAVLWIVGVLLLVTSVFGIIGSLRVDFESILSAAKLSIVGLLGLALAPLIIHLPIPFTLISEYIILLRVPLLISATVISLPFLGMAYRSPFRSLLRGLFDVTPTAMLAVSLAACAVASTAADNAKIIYLYAYQRIPGLERLSQPPLYFWQWYMLASCLPVIILTVVFSIRQGHKALPLIGSAILGLASWLSVQLFTPEAPILDRLYRPLINWLSATGLFQGYVPQPGLTDPWPDQVHAARGFILAFLVYLILGLYGRWRLGKAHTVPALCSALMLLMLVCWSLSGLTFFLDRWHVPFLLVLALTGVLSAQSNLSDHFYHLVARNCPPETAPTPAQTILGSKSQRIVVVAANGGGIQAAAWSAQVLAGLKQQFGSIFTDSLRLISSVSGGSLGTACFVYSLSDPDLARDPAEAATLSSLDEVAWGLAWTDVFRALLPWLFGRVMGRGRALEKAWCLNSAENISRGSRMDRPLSDWNPLVAEGKLPAVILNATVAETGERLLLGTTRLDRDHSTGRARLDAADLHRVNGEDLDVAIVTAARLSASFPYVTPAARSDAPGPHPHIVDGGYFDNYGMSTLVEWLDEALSTTETVNSVLVLQIHGAPVKDDQPDVRHAKNRGWFYQAMAPLTTLAAVREAGQIAHNDIELEQLQEKWYAQGIPVHSVTFEFPDPNTPLSWHLTSKDSLIISDVWHGRYDPLLCKFSQHLLKKIQEHKRQVGKFLEGSDSLNCSCPKCRSDHGLRPIAEAAIA